MEGTIIWRQRAARGDDAGIILWSIACSPDSSRLVLGVGCCVLLVDAESGDTLHTLAGHKGNVNTVAFACNGEQFASGGADKQVIIWASNGEPLRHFTHSGSVQALAFNPRTLNLASGSTEELVLWHEEGPSGSHKQDGDQLDSNPAFDGSKFPRISRSSSRNWSRASSSLANAFVATLGLTSGSSGLNYSPSGCGTQCCNRIRVSSRICALSWDDEGQRLASGHYNGVVVVRDPDGSEVWRQQLGATAWAVSWRPRNWNKYQDNIIVACTFEPRVWILDADAKVAVNSTQLAYDPLAVAFAPGGEYFALVGVDGGLSLWNCMGMCLQPVDFSGEKLEATVCCFSPSGQRIVFTTRQGYLGVAQLRLPVVHGLHREVYARRTSLCEVTVRNLLTDDTLSIQFDGLVLKIAVYRRFLAVQLDGCIIIAELSTEASGAMKHREVHRLRGSFECSLMLLTAKSVVLCTGNTLRLHELTGREGKQWTLRAPVRYVRVLGGPPGAETLLVGLKNGEALYVFAHQGLPLPLLQHRVGIVCMDVSAERNRLAIVDEEKELYIYDLRSKKSVYSQQDCTSVAYHLSVDDLLAFTGRKTLFIKAGPAETCQQTCHGIVVGFLGSFTFCLHCREMLRIKVNHTASVQQLIRRGYIRKAYNVACLGATQDEWKQLGLQCMLIGDLQLARKAFQHQNDLRAICLINHVESELQSLKVSKEAHQHMCRAYANAFVQNFAAAADEWAAAGFPQRASEMFADLRRWGDARLWDKLAAQFKTEASDSGKQMKAATDSSATPEETAGGNIEQASLPDLPVASLSQKEQNEPVVHHELREAAALYLATGQLERACRIYAKLGEIRSLAEVMRRCKAQQIAQLRAEYGQPKLQAHRRTLDGSGEYPEDYEASVTLRLVACIFEESGQMNLAQEAMLALGDTVGYLRVLMQAGRWDEAVSRAEQDPSLLQQVLLPWGHELIRQDEPELAISVFRRAGKEHLALRVQSSLLEGAVSQKFFAQAAERSWALATAFANLADSSREGPHHPLSLTDYEGATTAHQSLNSTTAGPWGLPACVSRFLTCYFRRLSEVYGVYFVLMCQASSVLPKAKMPAHAVLRACIFLWSHALAPLGQAACVKQLEKTTACYFAPSTESKQPKLILEGAKRWKSGLGSLPNWRLPQWWRDAHDALDTDAVRTKLNLCGIRIYRRVKGIRTFLVLRLMTEAALQLHDFETAAAACQELRRLALRGSEQQKRAELELKVKATHASFRPEAGLAEASGALTKAVCGLCRASVTLLTSEAVPLGADLSCGKCGCPITLEFGTFAPIMAIECRRVDSAELVNGHLSFPSGKDFSPDELFLETIKESVIQPVSSRPSLKEEPFGPVEFQPPALSQSFLRNQPREKLIWRTNSGLEGCTGSNILRLFGLPHSKAEQAIHATFLQDSEAALRDPDMLMACGTCSHLFIQPPAYQMLSSGNLCIFCASDCPFTPILQCAALE